MILTLSPPVNYCLIKSITKMNNANQNDLDSLLTECAAVCRTCADACKDMPEMNECVRLCTECEQKCREISGQTNVSHEVYEQCALVCEACATECEKFDKAECRKCAEVCRKCAEACHQTA